MTSISPRVPKIRLSEQMAALGGRLHHTVRPNMPDSSSTLSESWTHQEAYS